jgi:hypothetical protein
MKERIINEVICCCGLSLIGYGLWLIYPPLAFIGTGAILAALGVWLQIRTMRRK